MPRKPQPKKTKAQKRARRQHAKAVQHVARDMGGNGGQPTTYNPTMAKMAKAMCEMGATDAELAEFFGVTVVTIWNWGTRHQEFFNALHRGKAAANERVKRAVYAKATGYSYESEKIHVTPTGEVIRVSYLEHVPPSDGAGRFWLTNRESDEWKERVTNEFDPEKPLKIVVDGGLPTK